MTAAVWVASYGLPPFPATTAADQKMGKSLRSNSTGATTRTSIKHPRNPAHDTITSAVGERGFTEHSPEEKRDDPVTRRVARSGATRRANLTVARDGLANEFRKGRTGVWLAVARPTVICP